MASTYPPLRFGLLGAGRFGTFCLGEFRQMAEVQVVAVADQQPEAAKRVAEEFGITAMDPQAMLRGDAVDFVHIATPPATHHELVMAALDSGKHVLCEKPLAIDLDQAHAMVAKARDVSRVLAVNLIMRYNPLCRAVQRLLSEKLLGEPLHAFFENYAKDEPLGPEHWFWDREKSGGIFIEHGVHFFDLFAMWLGFGQVVAAQQTRRPSSDLIEQVNCQAVYGANVLVNFYHGFHQAARMDRQEMRIVCERGDIRLFEWVPTQIQIDCIAQRAALDAIVRILPSATVQVEEEYEKSERKVTSRHKSYEVDGRFIIRSDTGMDKDALYGYVVRELLREQVQAAHEAGRHRWVTEENGVSSLQMACDARDMA